MKSKLEKAFQAGKKHQSEIDKRFKEGANRDVIDYLDDMTYQDYLKQKEKPRPYFYNEGDGGLP